MTDDLKQFLYQANTHGYGSSNISEEKLENGEHVIRFSDNNFEFKDVYYGGEPYAGQEVIFYDGRAVWAMQYRGEIIEGEDFAPIYAFLGKALSNTSVGLPRGIDGFSENDFLYSFTMSGNIENFSAQEKIFHGGKVVYRAKFLGGLVDLRKEN